MKVIQTFAAFLERLDPKDFYKYMGVTLVGITFISFFIMYRFVSSANHYQQEINSINIQREEIRELIEKATLIKRQKQAINAMLEADPDFRIGGYFLDTLKQLHLTQKSETSSVTPQERPEQGYNENILSVKFTDMNMKELTELLDMLDQNKRIYTKELDIQRSKKAPQTLEVHLTIATLQPRLQASEYTE